MTARVLGLDYVRAFAIGLVLLCHFLDLFSSAPARILYPLGTLGVETFFVLSGYLIGGIFLRDIARNHGRVDWGLVRGFWWRRWLRTLPNYLLFLAIALVLAGGTDGATLFRYLTFRQAFFSGDISLLEISWSLAIEEWFYLCLPLLVWWFFAVFRSIRPAVIASVIALTLVPVALRWTLGAGEPWDQVVRKATLFRLDAIMRGVALALIKFYRSGWFARLQKIHVSLAGGAVCVLSIWLQTQRTPSGDVDFISTHLDTLLLSIYDLGPALLIPGCAAWSSVHRFLDPVVVRTSLWSYSLYLSHPIVMAFVYTTIPSKFGWVHALISAALTFGVSGAIYHFFERPIMNLRDHSKPAPTRPVAPDPSLP